MPGTLGVILAGGAGRRIGGGKPFRRLPDGRRLVDVAAALLEAAGVGEAVIAGTPPAGPDGDAAAVPDGAADWPLPILPDARPGEGPLAGIEAALAAAIDRGCSRLLVVPCDMPWLAADDLRRLAAHPAALVHPAPGGLPLAADAAPVLLARVRDHLDRGERRLRDLLAAAGAVALPVADADRGRFANVNRPGDLAGGDDRPRGGRDELTPGR